MHDHNFVWRKISAKIHLPLNWPFDNILDFKIVWDFGVRDSYGQGKQDSHAQKNYPLSALLQLTFCLPVPMYLNKQKYELFWSLIKDQSIVVSNHLKIKKKVSLVMIVTHKKKVF